MGPLKIHPNESPGLGKRLRNKRPVRWARKFLPRDLFDPEKLKLWWEVLPYTMCSYEKLANVYELACEVEEQKLEGAFVECGVWRGGCSAVMAYVAHRAGSGRASWLFDSFEGLPEPTEEDGEEAIRFAQGRKQGQMSAIGQNVASRGHVERIFGKLDLTRNVHVEQGWFQDTVPRAAPSVGPIAILRLDGDWYESTMVCLEGLFDHIVTGGALILDDFDYWQGSKKATEDFFERRGLQLPMHRVDEQAVWFRKV